MSEEIAHACTQAPYCWECSEVWACWCGHTREQHAADLVGECLICRKCDEWQVEFCDYIERTAEHEIVPQRKRCAVITNLEEPK